MSAVAYAVPAAATVTTKIAIVSSPTPAAPKSSQPTNSEASDSRSNAPSTQETPARTKDKSAPVQWLQSYVIGAAATAVKAGQAASSAAESSDELDKGDGFWANLGDLIGAGALFHSEPVEESISGGKSADSQSAAPSVTRSTGSSTVAASSASSTNGPALAAEFASERQAADRTALDHLAGQWSANGLGRFQSFAPVAIPANSSPPVDTASALETYDSVIDPFIHATVPITAEGGGTPGEFTVTRTGPLDNPLTVYYTVSGSATGGEDYVPLPGFVTIGVGQDTGTILVQAIDDALDEGSEWVTVELTPHPSYVLSEPTIATVIIVDNTVSVTASDPVASEVGFDPGEFTITRTGELDDDLLVFFSIEGTATSGDDFQPIQSWTVIPAGLSNVLIPVAPLDDLLADGDETVVLKLQDNPTYLVGYGEATVTILDDEPSVSIIPTDPDAAETGDNTGTFTVTRTGPLGADMTVFYWVEGTAIPDRDYEDLPREVVIPMGQASATITVTPIDDAFLEGPETVTVYLSSDIAYSVSASSSATVTIADDAGDDGPQLSIEVVDGIAAEAGLDPARFQINRTGSNANDLTVYYATFWGNASDGEDFTPLPGQATILAGFSSVDVDLIPLQDSLGEGDEYVGIGLWIDDAYDISENDSVTILILDDEPVVTIAGLGPVTENGSPTDAFEVTRTGPTTAPLTVFYSVEGDAEAGPDYVALPGSVTIPVGQASAVIQITPVNDSAAEGDERIYLLLEDDASYFVGQPYYAFADLLDDEPQVSLIVTDADAGESGPNPGNFQIWRTGSTAAPLNVFYAVAGTATNGVDYASLSGTAVIPVGQSYVDVQIMPILDAIPEDSETVFLTVLEDPDYTVSPTDFKQGLFLHDVAMAAGVAIDVNSDKPGDDVAIRKLGAAHEANASGNIPVRLTVKNNGDAGTIKLSVPTVTFMVNGEPTEVPMGKFSTAQFFLGADKSREIMFTPIVESTAVNDVVITAKIDDVEKGKTTMTIVAVDMPSAVNAPTTPEKMTKDKNYRIPPNLLNKPELVYEYNIKLSLDLSTAEQEVMFRIEENFGEATEPEEIAKARGTVWVNGKGPNLDGIVLNKLNNTIKLKATQQTSPGNAKQLRFKVWTGPRVKPSGADVPGMFGDRFSVAALPVKLTAKWKQDVGGDRRGFIVAMGAESDSGQSKDLDKVGYFEKIVVTSETGVFEKKEWNFQKGEYLGFDNSLGDKHTSRVGWIVADGTVTQDQVWLFKDTRTGATGVVVPNSGFRIVHRVFKDTDNKWKLELTKTARQNKVLGYTAAAGVTDPAEGVTKTYDGQWCCSS